MDQKLRPEIGEIRRMSSGDAASYLLDKYPREASNWHVALRIIPHRSWKAKDQLRLAEHYFATPAFASPRPYEVFAAFMSLENFLSIMKVHAVYDASRRDLLCYHLGGVLQIYETNEQNRQRVSAFLKDLS